MEDYKPNSHKSKAPPQPQADGSTYNPQRKKVEPVVSNPATVREKSAIRKFADALIEEDGKTVGKYVFYELFVPGVKALLYNIIVGGAGKFLNQSGRTNSNGQIPYSQQYRTNNQQVIRRQQQIVDPLKPEDLIFGIRGDAEVVLDSMRNEINTYGFVDALTMYRLAGYDGNNLPYTWANIGWIDLRTARVEPSNGGYCIRLPRYTKLR